MKKLKLNAKKLDLGKKTVANLTKEDLQSFLGGNTPVASGFTVCNDSVACSTNTPSGTSIGTPCSPGDCVGGGGSGTSQCASSHTLDFACIAGGIYTQRGAATCC
ncbi:hypothetical protein [Pedobacter suwonensis]|uniref:hypothetical protein n=1 Tax=Pedobacter suwonensis TaxID=332999 RepID=UPI00369E804B